MTQRVSELETQLLAAEEVTERLAGAETEVPQNHEHLTIVPGHGYRLVIRQGAAPSPGEIVELDDDRYRCLRVSASPIPGDDRRCAVLESVPAPSEP